VNKNSKDILERVTEASHNLQESKTDYLVNTDSISFNESMKPDVTKDKIGSFSITTPDGEWALTDHAHRQVAQYARIPLPYYGRIARKHPELLCESVNKLMHEEPDARLLRTVDGFQGLEYPNVPTARAFLSDRYKRMDSDVMLNAITPILENYDIEITKAELNHESLGFQVRFPRVEGEVSLGDTVQSGFYLGNSEVGLHRMIGALNTYKLSCTNGMVRMENEHTIGRVHLGGSMLDCEDPKLLEAPAQLMIENSVRQIAEYSSSQDAMDAYIADMAKANNVMSTRPDDLVVHIRKQYHLSNFEAEQVKLHLHKDADYTLWGFANAVTRTAQDVTSYERAIALETVGGRVAGHNQVWVDSAPVIEIG
jgi:hypothetical protein